MKIPITLAFLTINFLLYAQTTGEFQTHPLSKNSFTAPAGDGIHVLYEYESINVLFDKTIEPFLTASIVFDGDENTEWRLQAETSEGKTLWYKLLINNHDIPTHNRHVTQMLVLPKNVVKITLRASVLSNNQAPQAELHLYNPRISQDFRAENTLPELNTRAACTCAKPAVAARSAWGAPATQSNGCTPSYTNVTHQIVHHSEGNYDSSTNWAAAVKSIWNYHVNSNGWCDVGYNYLVAPNGQIFEGRAGGDNVLGAHFCGKNAKTMGICMIGNYMQFTPTDTAIASLTKLLAWKGCNLGIDPSLSSLHTPSNAVIYNTSGHREGCNTDCPGDKLFPLLPKIRTESKKVWQSCTSIVLPNEELSEAGKIEIFPNPTEGVAHINFDLNKNCILKLKITEVSTGRIIFNFNDKNILNNHVENVDLQRFASGLYLLELVVDDKVLKPRLINKI